MGEPTSPVIRDGIEWSAWEGIEHAACARCGSSAEFLDCWNCDHGWVEIDDGDGIVEALCDVPCPHCDGSGGSWHCVSSPEWCAANPLADRESVESTALKSDVWNDR